MLTPSIESLKNEIDSKYTLVTLASKRAREMQEDKTRLLNSYGSHKNVGKALEEVAAGRLKKEKQDDSIIYEDEV